ncbi:MAG: heme A synthase [Phycisphaerae bacterium]
MNRPPTIPAPPSDHPPRENPWLHRFAVVLACLTLFLIVAGGMVTSTGSGLSVPDWPNTYGRNMFTFPISQWVGGIFYEHGHRLIASTVGFLTIVLAVWLQWVEPRRWLRRLGWIALLTVICQGVLGGLTVLYLLPTPVSVFHACLAQTFFCIVISIAVFTSLGWKHRTTRSPNVDHRLVRRMCIATVIVVSVQLLLGALMRHTESGLAVPDFPLAYGQWVPDLGAGAIESYNQDRAFLYQLPPVSAQQIIFHMVHRAGAVLVTILILTTATILLRRHSETPVLRSPARMVIVLLLVQIGLGAWTVWSGRTATIATAHVAVGAATLGICWLLTIRVFSLLPIPMRDSAVPATTALTGVTA